jgi:DNA-binding beta-propeller fold protein YncE
MFIGGDINDTIYQYTLSSAFDITTASYTGNSFYVGNEITSAPRTVFFRSDGINMFILDIGDDRVYQYTLSSAFDITTATYTGNSFYVGNEDATPVDLTFSPDGLNMFMVGVNNDTVHQYTLS